MANGNKGVVKLGGRSFGWRYLLVGFWLAACGGAFGSRTAGGESHFLRQCDDECGPGLECVSGVCTRGCLVGEDKCTDLAEAALCTDASIEPGAVAVCDVSCESDAGCAALGEAFTCEGGFCRGPWLPGHSPAGSAGAGGSDGNGASAGSGAGAVSAGGEPATGFYQVPRCGGGDRNVSNPLLAGGTPCPDGMSCVRDYDPAGDQEANSGVCVGDSAVGACASAADCPEGFDCNGDGDCLPTQANCWSNWTCPALVPACSYGYAHSRVGVVDGVADCVGPCVPVTRCGCSNDAECPVGTVCELGQCQQPLPWQPPNECALPFDVGPCDAAMRVFAFVDGACQEQTYGGCEGNANRFDSLERCMAVCEGRPLPNPCPEGREPHITCLECLPDDACGEWADVCAERCTTDDDCSTFGHVCQDGACGAICS
jgi:hypothetical protein